MAEHRTMSKTAADSASAAEPMQSGYYFRPNVDIVEKADELTVLADMPGARADGIEVNFEDGMLTIRAKVPPRHENVEFLVHEYAVGDFYRTFRIHETIDASKITAEYADGVLTLHLPKSEAAKPRKISVKA